MIGPALIGAAGNVVSGIASAFGAADANDKSIELFQKQKKFNLAMWRRNKKFSKKMSNTAYQRAMKDMRKAGLNPMLAYKQGGANVPNIGTAQAPAAPTIRNEFEGGLGIGEAAMAYNQIKNVNANTRLVNEKARSEHFRGNRLEKFDPIVTRIGQFVDGLDRLVDDLAPSMRDPKQLADTVLDLVSGGDNSALPEKTKEAAREIVEKKAIEYINEKRGSDIGWKEYRKYRRKGISPTGAHEIRKRNKDIKRHPKMRYRQW